MKLSNVNATVCIVWSVTNRNFRNKSVCENIRIATIVQRMYRNLIYKFFLAISAVAVGTEKQGMWRGSYGM